MKFIDTNLNENIKKALVDIGYENLTNIQEKTIEHILNNINVVAMSSTGSGKTAAFMLPLIHNIDNNEKSTQVLIVTPTRELAIQIVQETRKFCKYIQGVNSLAVYGGQDIRNQAINLRRGVRIVVGTPGRIKDLIKKRILRLNNVKSIVLDEADEMLSMGFYEEVNSIIDSIPKTAQKLFFSATIDNRVKDIAQKKAKNAIFIESMDNDTKLVDNITQIAIDVKEKMKNECVVRIINKINSKSTVVFCNTKKKTENVFSYLIKNNIKADILTSDIEQYDRERTLKKFKEAKLDVLVVTDVMARGIDIKNLELVINYDIPIDNEYYVHRIGRTARQGRSGISYTFYTGKQIERIKELEEYTNTKFEFEDVPLSNKEEIKIELPLNKRGKYVLTISLGKKDNIKAKDIIGAISALTGIKSQDIGIIEVGENTSTIELLKEQIADVVGAFENGKIKGKDVHIIK